jgi:hypothetical protein
MNLALHVSDQTRESKRRLVSLAHEESLQYHRIELAACPPHQKPVQLFTDRPIYLTIYIYNRKIEIDREKRKKERDMY